MGRGHGEYRSVGKAADLDHSLLVPFSFCLTVLFSNRAIGIINFEKTFSKFKFIVGLETLLREGLSEPEFYCDLVYKFKKFIGRNKFCFQFR